MKFKFISSILLVFFFALTTACTEKPKQTLRIGAVLWPGYEPLYLANKLGYFKDQPIKVIDYLSNTDALQSFINHNLEAGAFTLDETLQLLAKNIELEIILIMDTSYGGDVILANPDIRSVSDLKGKPVAVESSAVGAYVLKRALELNDMSYKDIQVVSTNAMEQLSAFNKNKVVAAVSFDPYRTKLVKYGKKEIFNSTLIPDEIIDVLVVRKQYSKDNPEVLSALIQAWFKTLKYQQDNPRISADYSSKRFETTTEEYLNSLKRLRFISKKKNKLLLDNDNSPLLYQQDKMIEILKQINLIDGDTRLNGHLSNKYIQ